MRVWLMSVASVQGGGCPWISTVEGLAHEHGFRAGQGGVPWISTVEPCLGSP